ncbi:hypothetical protein EXIGLDRAFT_764520 [Exidia glandulosa HHB12029]|uniref:Uncharacterized protein n=1 Tax=Exidia glandulosa HHB12029 TaxID=1314781 RepID=A0A166B2S8_EXIGL|nr:hypothetical protein EXIGLDRAFT_764520 [Exidia glandulosa HHB12029]
MDRLSHTRRPAPAQSQAANLKQSQKKTLEAQGREQFTQRVLRQLVDSSFPSSIARAAPSPTPEARNPAFGFGSDFTDLELNDKRPMRRRVITRPSNISPPSAPSPAEQTGSKSTTDKPAIPVSGSEYDYRDRVRTDERPTVKHHDFSTTRGGGLKRRRTFNDASLQVGDVQTDEHVDKKRRDDTATLPGAAAQPQPQVFNTVRPTPFYGIPSARRPPSPAPATPEPPVQPRTITHTFELSSKEESLAPPTLPAGPPSATPAKVAYYNTFKYSPFFMTNPVPPSSSGAPADPSRASRPQSLNASIFAQQKELSPTLRHSPKKGPPPSQPPGLSGGSMFREPSSQARAVSDPLARAPLQVPKTAAIVRGPSKKQPIVVDHATDEIKSEKEPPTTSQPTFIDLTIDESDTDSAPSSPLPIFAQLRAQCREDLEDHVPRFATAETDVSTAEECDRSRVAPETFEKPIIVIPRLRPPLAAASQSSATTRTPLPSSSAASRTTTQTSQDVPVVLSGPSSSPPVFSRSSSRPRRTMPQTTAPNSSGRTVSASIQARALPAMAQRSAALRASSPPPLPRPHRPASPRSSTHPRPRSQVQEAAPQPLPCEPGEQSSSNYVDPTLDEDEAESASKPVSPSVANRHKRCGEELDDGPGVTKKFKAEDMTSTVAPVPAHRAHSPVASPTMAMDAAPASSSRSSLSATRESVAPAEATRVALPSPSTPEALPASPPPSVALESDRRPATSIFQRRVPPLPPVHDQVPSPGVTRALSGDASIPMPAAAESRSRASRRLTPVAHGVPRDVTHPPRVIAEHGKRTHSAEQLAPESDSESDGEDEEPFDPFKVVMAAMFIPHCGSPRQAAYILRDLFTQFPTAELWSRNFNHKHLNPYNQELQLDDGARVQFKTDLMKLAKEWQRSPPTGKRYKTTCVDQYPASPISHLPVNRTVIDYYRTFCIPGEWRRVSPLRDQPDLVSYIKWRFVKEGHDFSPNKTLRLLPAGKVPAEQLLKLSGKAGAVVAAVRANPFL